MRPPKFKFKGSMGIAGLFLVCFLPLFSHPLLADDEALIQSTDEKINKTKQEQGEPASPLPELKKQGQRIEEPVAKTAPGEIVHISHIHIYGNKVLKRSQFQDCTNKVINKAVSENDLHSLTDCMTKLYLDAGYSLSRAIIPPQDIVGGRLKIKVIEGYIKSYQIDGIERDDYNIAAHMNIIQAERPLKLKTLERQLLLINDIPGLTLKDTSLEEIGELTGAFKLVLFVDYWKIWSSNAIDNRGTKAIGPLQTYNNLYFNSALFKGDTIGLTYSSIADSTNELNFGALSIDVPIGATGLRLQGYLSTSMVKPSDNRKLTKTEYDLKKASVNLTYSIRRSMDFSAWIGGGFWTYSYEKQDTGGLFVDDEATGLSLDGSLSFFDPFGAQTNIYASLRKGLDVGTPSKKGDPLNSTSDGDGEFTRFNLSYQRYQAINDNWSFYIDTHLQLASNGLLTLEEYNLGGYRFGRGFETGVISGDNIAAASLELRYYKNINYGWLNGAQFYGFIDVGSVFDDGFHSSNGAFLSSAGGGIRLYLDHGINASFEIGIPLDKSNLDPTEVDNAEYSFHISRSQKIKDYSFESLIEASPLGLLRQ